MARSESLKKRLLDGLCELYTENVFTDVVVEVEGRQFRCHRLVLSAVSPVLKAMFLSGMSESISGHVTLGDVTAAAFEAILQAVYQEEEPGKVLTNENVQEVHYASCILGLEALAAAAEVFITSRLSPENALDVWRHAKRLGQQTMACNALHFITDNFVAFRAEGHLRSLTLEEVRDLISSDDLMVPNENVVLESALEWVAADREANEPLFPELVSHIRLCFLEDNCFSDFVQGHEFFQTNNDCRQLIKKTLKFFASPATRWQEEEEFCRPRLGFREELGLVLYGKDLSNTSRASLAHFSFSSQKFHLDSHCPFWKDLGDKMAFCGSGELLFVSGGTKTFQFHTLSQTWTRLPELPADFHDHALVAHGRNIYVIGGWSISERRHDVYAYDVTNADKNADWRPFGSLTKLVSSFGAAVAGDGIFVVGGSPLRSAMVTEDQAFPAGRDSVEQTASVQRLDLSSGECEVVTSLFHVWQGGQVTLLPDGWLYIFHASGIVERLCPSTYELEEVCKLQGIKKKKKFAVVPHQKTLYVFGQPERTEAIDFAGLEKAVYIDGKVCPEGCVKTLIFKNRGDSTKLPSDPPILPPARSK